MSSNDIIQVSNIDIVYIRTTGRGQPSGYGFEITFRLKREEGDTTPPTWPAELIRSLARYVFQSGMSE